MAAGVLDYECVYTHMCVLMAANWSSEFILKQF